MKAVAIPIIAVIGIVMLIPFTAPGVQKALVRRLIDSRIADRRPFNETDIMPWHRAGKPGALPIVKRYRISPDLPVLKAANPQPTAASTPAAVATSTPPSPTSTVTVSTTPGSEPNTKAVSPLPFSIQVSAGRNRGKALNLARRLRADGSPAYTHRHVDPNAVEWFRVYVGAYVDRKTAARQATSLRRHFPGAFVTRTPPSMPIATEAALSVPQPTTIAMAHKPS